MRITLASFFGLISWFGAIFGCLQLHRLDLGHSICGPWGCGPPTSALLGWHCLWFVLLIPVGMTFTRISPAWGWRKFGMGLLAAASVTALAIGIHDYFSWQPDLFKPAHVIQRFFFKLAILIDVPVIQTGILGLVMACSIQRLDATDSASESGQVSESPFQAEL